MSERSKDMDLSSDPDVARALALFSGAKAEAEALIPGSDEESVKRRIELQSRLTRDLIERSGLGAANGELKVDREISQEHGPAVQGSTA